MPTLAELTDAPNAVLKAALRRLVTEAEQMEIFNTTPAALQALETALAQAKSVLDGSNAAQAEVDCAYKALETGLELTGRK